MSVCQYFKSFSFLSCISVHIGELKLLQRILNSYTRLKCYQFFSKARLSIFFNCNVEWNFKFEWYQYCPFENKIITEFLYIPYLRKKRAELPIYHGKMSSLWFHVDWETPKTAFGKYWIEVEDPLNIKASGPVLTTNATQPFNQIELYDRVYNDKCSLQPTNKKIQTSKCLVISYQFVRKIFNH